MRRLWGRVFITLIISSFCCGEPVWANLHVSACGTKPKDPKKTVVLSDLSQPPGAYSVLPPLNQGDHHTCYAMASAHFLGAFMTPEDRRRSGGCLPMEQITRERIRSGRIKGKVRQSIDYGYSTLSVFESADQGQCCSSRALGPDQANKVYGTLQEYSKAVETSEGYLHREELEKLRDTIRSRIVQELSGEKSPLLQVREYQRLNQDYDDFLKYYHSRWISADQQGRDQLDSEYNKIRDRRLDRYGQAINEIEMHLFKEEKDFRNTKLRIHALEKEQTEFSPFVEGFARKIAVLKLEEALSPQECIPDEFLLTTNPKHGEVDGLIRSSLEALAQIPDGVIQNVDRMLKPLCQGNTVKLSPEIKNTLELEYQPQNEHEFAKKIRENLADQSPRPVLFALCAEVLDEDALMYSQYLKTQRKALHSASKSDRVSLPQCSGHAVVLIGARWEKGQCQYLVRDSVSDRSQERWMPAEVLIDSALSVTTVR